MLRTTLHNPTIAKDSYIENLVIEKLDNTTETKIYDPSNNKIPEIGRMWFNTDEGSFKFTTTDGTNPFVSVYLSQTDKRNQQVVSKLSIINDLTVTDGTNNQLFVDVANKVITISNNTTTVSSDNGVSVTSANGTVSIDGKLVSDLTNNKLNADYSSIELNNTTLNITSTDSITVTDGNTEQLKVDTANKTLSINNTSVAINSTNKVEVTVSNFNINNKLIVDNSNDTIEVSYNTVNVNSTDTTITNTNKITVSDSQNDKIVLDNTNDVANINYNNININSGIIIKTVNVEKVVDSNGDEKLTVDTVNNKTVVNTGSFEVNGDTTINGTAIVAGDLIVKGNATKLDVESENVKLADNIITLNSNLTKDDDPRAMTAVTDLHAGIEINRGKEGILPILKWVESTDTSSDETLKEGKTYISIWNYEAETPAYELHQIIEDYTLGREVKDVSGSSWVGYDGHEGPKYTQEVNNGVDPSDALKYTFKLDNSKLDVITDNIVEEIDSIKYNLFNSVRSWEASDKGKEFTIKHNLSSEFVDVRVQVLDKNDNSWYFDTLPVQVIDANTIKVVASEEVKIRIMIKKLEGFTIPNSDVTVA